MKDLSKSWIIINIGNRRYAVNTSYVTGFTALNSSDMLSMSNNRFIRGMYNIFNSETVVIDGHKIACEKSQDDYIDTFCRVVTSIKINVQCYLDYAAVAAIYDKETNNLEKHKYEIYEELEKIECNNDHYMTTLKEKSKFRVDVMCSRVNDLVESYRNGKISILNAIDKLSDVEKESRKYIYDTLDKMVEYIGKKKSEMCMIVSAGRKRFGISIDSIDIIDSEIAEIGTKKLSNLSAGSVKISDTLYNILDLTKISKLVG